MTSRFVLDASVVLAWLLEENHRQQALDLLEASLVPEAAFFVPPNWSLEVCNAVREAVRTERVTAATQIELQQAVLSLPILSVPPSPCEDWAVILPTALQYGLSTYDAAYLSLALQERLPLATFDDLLREKAENLGIDCLPN